MESAAEDGEGVAELFQTFAEFAGARGDGDFRFELFEDVGGDAFEEGDTGFERGSEVELAVHGACGDGGDFFLDADESGDFVDDLLLDEGGVHVKYCEALVTAVEVGWLDDDFAVPFSLEVVYRLVLGEKVPGKVFRIRRWGECDFNYAWLGRVGGETTVGRGEASLFRGIVDEQTVQSGKEVGEA